MPVIKCYNRYCPGFDAGAVDHCGAILDRLQNCPKAVLRYDIPQGQDDYTKARMSNECQCGEEKSPGYAFCRRCYGQLPGELQKDLWSRGSRYNEAYDAAVAELDEVE